jgi:hypothetical protein
LCGFDKSNLVPAFVSVGQLDSRLTDTTSYHHRFLKFHRFSSTHPFTKNATAAINPAVTTNQRRFFGFNKIENLQQKNHSLADVTCIIFIFVRNLIYYGNKTNFKA